MAAQLCRFSLALASLFVCSVAAPQEPLRSEFEEAVPLPADELRQITVSLLERYPQLAASPGVKVAAAPLGGPGKSVGTAVVFYPHSESLGIKEALVAYCGRTYPDKNWTCPAVEVRSYAQLPSQDFEVRVRGEISSAAALAAIEGSRRDLQAVVTDGSDLPSTAIMVKAQEDGRYFVTWGTPEGLSRVVMLARLTPGGDPTNSDDWQASIFTPPENEIRETHIALSTAR
jgi:hypothetical protein